MVNFQAELEFKPGLGNMTILHHPRQGRTQAFQSTERQAELGGGADLGVAVRTLVAARWGCFCHPAAVGDSSHGGGAVDLRMVLGKWGEAGKGKGSPRPMCISGKHILRNLVNPT